MKIRLLITVILLLSSVFLSQAKEISVMTYNLCNYFVADETAKPKSGDSKKALMGMIRTANPDILFAVELGGEKSLADLMENLKSAGCKDYIFSDEMTGEDESRHIGFISKYKPVKLEKKENLFYRIKPKNDEYRYAEKVFVQRGFLHAVFEFEGDYRLHVVGAHLKSRLPHPRYIQTDMRRYEARLLRYLVNEIQEKERDANILVVGDLNDTYSSDPLITLRAPEKSFGNRLYDLRPLDSSGLPWTHWWHSEDIYGRIDFTLASASILPEINFDRTKVVHLRDYWMFASDHRPVLVSINTENSAPWAKEKIDKYFPAGVHLDNSTDTALPTRAVKTPDTPENISVCLFDAGGYASADPAGRKWAMVRDLKISGAEIIVLSGVKDAASAAEIKRTLTGYGFMQTVEGSDKGSVLAVISRIKPEKSEALTDIKYKIDEKEIPLSRGFAHCVFNVGGYKFHLVGADLKDRRKHPEFNQTDMRRYEARQLRYLVNDISKKEPDSNILVVGNLNDTCGMSPLKELYNRRSGIEKRLFDIRPTDSMKTTWTYWNRETDDFERIDYAMASFTMISEIVREKTEVLQTDSWEKDSPHRPLLINIRCKDADKPSKEDLDKNYPHCIYSGEATHFEEDREIGDKAERKKPADPNDE
ncbi:MAG: endonuclease/exonuclease/phosphatase family protein [Victivallales bacterium]|jgi:endonuclease/exonuclease/phosphatase family metal-dependent hydrolase